MSDRKQINFTIVPDDDSRRGRGPTPTSARVNHTPFDFTLTFCEVQPLSEKEIREAEAEHVVKRAGAREDRDAGAVRADPHRGAAGEPAHLLGVASAAAGAASA